MRQPDEIHWVRHGQLSIARHYGGINFNGAEYVYVPICETHGKDCDVLIRKDVFKARRKAKKKPAPAPETALFPEGKP